MVGDRGVVAYLLSGLRPVFHATSPNSSFPILGLSCDFGAPHQPPPVSLSRRMRPPVGCDRRYRRRRQCIDEHAVSYLSPNEIWCPPPGPPRYTTPSCETLAFDVPAHGRRPIAIFTCPNRERGTSMGTDEVSAVDRVARAQPAVIQRRGRILMGVSVIRPHAASLIRSL